MGLCIAIEFHFSHNSDRMDIFSSSTINLSSRHCITFLIKWWIHWFCKKSHQFNSTWKSWSMSGIFLDLGPNIIYFLCSRLFQIFVSWKIRIWNVWSLWKGCPKSWNLSSCFIIKFVWNIMNLLNPAAVTQQSLWSLY